MILPITTSSYSSSSYYYYLIYFEKHQQLDHLFPLPISQPTSQSVSQLVSQLSHLCCELGKVIDRQTHKSNHLTTSFLFLPSLLSSFLPILVAVYNSPMTLRGFAILRTHILAANHPPSQLSTTAVYAATATAAAAAASCREVVQHNLVYSTSVSSSPICSSSAFLPLPSTPHLSSLPIHSSSSPLPLNPSTYPSTPIPSYFSSSSSSNPHLLCLLTFPSVPLSFFLFL